LTSVHGLLNNVFKDADKKLVPMHTVVELNHHTISREFDLSPTAINVLFCSLDFYGRYVDALSNIQRKLVMNRYRVRRAVDDFDALCQSVFERQQQRESAEIGRLNTMLACLTGENTACQTAFLIRYFGEEVISLLSLM
jgi:hypothetical protein